MILKLLLVLGCGIIPDEQRTVAERGGGKSKALQLGAEGSWSGIQVSWHRGDRKRKQVTVDSHRVYQPAGSFALLP